MILAAVGLPAEAIGVLLVLDRLLDMARTAVNVFSDAACAVIVARLEGEPQVLKGEQVVLSRTAKKPSIARAEPPEALSRRARLACGPSAARRLSAPQPPGD